MMPSRPKTGLYQGPPAQGEGPGGVSAAIIWRSVIERPSQSSKRSLELWTEAAPARRASKVVTESARASAEGTGRGSSRPDWKATVRSIVSSPRDGRRRSNAASEPVSSAGAGGEGRGGGRAPP